MPETRARISTSREPSAWPTASSEIGTAFEATLMVVTGRAGGAAACVEAESPPLAQAAARMAAERSASAGRAAAEGVIGTISSTVSSAGFVGYYTYHPERM